MNVTKNGIVAAEKLSKEIKVNKNVLLFVLTVYPSSRVTIGCVRITEKIMIFPYADTAFILTMHRLVKW